MNKAYLLVDGDFAVGAVFDEDWAHDIAESFDLDIEEIDYVDEVN